MLHAANEKVTLHFPLHNWTFSSHLSTFQKKTPKNTIWAAEKARQKRISKREANTADAVRFVPTQDAPISHPHSSAVRTRAAQGAPRGAPPAAGPELSPPRVLKRRSRRRVRPSLRGAPAALEAE